MHSKRSPLSHRPCDAGNVPLLSFWPESFSEFAEKKHSQPTGVFGNEMWLWKLDLKVCVYVCMCFGYAE